MNGILCKEFWNIKIKRINQLNMKEIKPIDRKRNSGGWTEIGTKEDGVAICLTKFKDRLIIIKEKSMYELMTADDIDPERTNIELPNMVQKLIINQGTESELVSRTFLTAYALFKPNDFDNSIDIEKALQLSLEILQELIMLEEKKGTCFICHSFNN